MSWPRKSVWENKSRSKLIFDRPIDLPSRQTVWHSQTYKTCVLPSYKEVDNDAALAMTLRCLHPDL